LNLAIYFNPDLDDAYNNRGVAGEAQGNLQGAIADFNTAIRLNPHNAITYLNRGDAYADLGNLRRAIADYTHYLELGGGQRYGDQAQVESLIRTLKERMRP